MNKHMYRLILPDFLILVSTGFFRFQDSKTANGKADTEASK